MASFRYRILISDTAGVQREIRFHRLDENAPRLDALYGSTTDLSDFKNGAEVSIDPDEHAKRISDLRAKHEEEQAKRQADSLKRLGKAPEGSDGIAAKGTAELPKKPAQDTPPPTEPK